MPFRVFEYASKEGGPRFDQRLASLQLPIALPDLFVSGAQPSAKTGGSGTARCRSASQAVTTLGSTTNERRS